MSVTIVSTDEMRALEAAAFRQGATEAELQERAGTAVAEDVAALLEPGDSVVVLVGPGNNGRDGAVAARHLAGRASRVTVLLSPRHGVRQPELLALRAAGVRVSSAERAEDVAEALRTARIAIDALTGIGARGPLREPLASLAAALNQAARRHGCLVVALDMPSGIDADTGAIPGEAVRAHRTVTLGAVKQGLLRFPAAALVGTLVCRSIGIPDAAMADLPYRCADENQLASLLPQRPLDAHKYRFGRVLVVAGSDHYLGAPLLCASAAARAGAGLVTLASTAAVRAVVAHRLPEVTFPESDVAIAADPEAALEGLLPQLRDCAVLLVGPGLGRAEPVMRFVRLLIERRLEVAAACGLVVDADALFALADWPGWWHKMGGRAILTPHSGELGRLAGPAAPTETSWAQAARLAGEWGCVLVAKGPFTSVAAPDGRVSVWPRANPALATGGTGDVLAGLIAGLMAQGTDPWDAARLGTAAHALAAASVLRDRGWRTLLASDLLPEIPAVLHTLAAPQPGAPS